MSTVFIDTPKTIATAKREYLALAPDGTTLGVVTIVETTLFAPAFQPPATAWAVKHLVQA